MGEQEGPSCHPRPVSRGGVRWVLWQEGGGGGLHRGRRGWGRDSDLTLSQGDASLRERWDGGSLAVGRAATPRADRMGRGCMRGVWGAGLWPSEGRSPCPVSGDTPEVCPPASVGRGFGNNPSGDRGWGWGASQSTRGHPQCSRRHGDAAKGGLGGGQTVGRLFRGSLIFKHVIFFLAM